MTTTTLNIDLNRVEGDLSFQVELRDCEIVDARCIGTLYRGFEQILCGRAARDAMVIVPRVCGICSTSHLYAGVLALENAWQLTVPPTATHIRNLCLMAEGVQNDLRQTFLFFTVDFCHDRYQHLPLYQTITEAFAPFAGKLYTETLAMTRRAVEIVAIFGGQWPHSSYMLPGGVVTPATQRRLIDSSEVVTALTRWYEQQVIGDSLDNWLALDSSEAFSAWLEQPKPAQSGVGLLTRFAHDLGLHQLGIGTGHMLSYGAYLDPNQWQSGADNSAHFVASGFYDADQGQVLALDQNKITEDVRYSWFQQYEGGRHPYQGQTIPDYQPQSDRYTWTKAPRYDDKVVQTGPLAELLIGGDALIQDLHRVSGGSAWLRQFARVRRTGHTLLMMRQTLQALGGLLSEPHFITPTPEQECDGEGYGLVMAARGALGHWVQVEEGKITRYQIITPTAWNASPRDSQGRHGHWEQSLLGLQIADPADPLEVGHIVRSHDPCLVCTVHFVESGVRQVFRV